MVFFVLLFGAMLYFILIAVGAFGWPYLIMHLDPIAIFALGLVVLLIVLRIKYRHDPERKEQYSLLLPYAIALLIGYSVYAIIFKY